MTPKKSPAHEESSSLPHDSATSDRVVHKQLYRSEANRMVGGIAGGLGDYFALDPVLFRVFFILLVLFGGSGFLLYLILWLIIPSESQLTNPNPENLQANAWEIKSTTKSMASSFTRTRNPNFIWGVFFMSIGLLFLLKNLGIFDYLEFDKLWPVVLIFLGIGIVLRR